ncbi:hypothetical protein H8711_01670 [Clostridiaceae bacterium NSJ-31]|uniref:Uroporphyrinogen decarboxylase (URO-D) domain-containing protein n=1 Tax=Ligaoa zhengdingensis TaxID=2763658 RepID=A0A926I3Y9_9FIRM|nr:uroporphyrinogen decarboxylase family protein [Ligaoa zhengdingensis]MBC8545646.1 hypothetical protein [Ligaoa zhengdingensis]
MTSKERVLMTIHHEEPDRVPVCATYVPEVAEKLAAKYHPDGDLGVALGNDMVKIASGLENSFYYKPDPEYVCPYGITWKNIRNETGHFTEIYKSPLAGDPQKIYDYVMPDPTQATDVIEATKDAIARYGKEKWIIGSCQCSVFEAAWYLRGLDTFMMDLAMEEDYAIALLDKVMQYPLQMGLQFIDLGVDMVWLGDDIATQQNMMMSPDMWREHFKPRYAEMFAAFKKRNPNIKLCYHSCGNLQAVVDDLVEIGLDVLNPIQPMAMNPAEFKKRFGSKVTMYGTLDVQQVMPFGSPEDVRNEVKKLIHDCAPGGGYILSPAHHIQSDTSVENIEAFYQAARDFGAYPIKV